MSAATVAAVTPALLEVENLRRSFGGGRRLGFLSRRSAVDAVAGISFRIGRGETLGLVGESGCGKSTTAKVVLNLIPATSGRVVFDGEEVEARSDSDWRPLRRRMQLVFQDPAGALNPRIRILDQVAEPLLIHNLGTGADAADRAAEALDAVGLDQRFHARYPHELSGGQQQRVVIARALILDPELVVCDEPVSALDVSIQAQVVALLRRLQKERGLTYLFISHDLSVVREISDRIAVMYLGVIVETGPTEQIFAAPRHPYTRALMSAVPVADPRVRRERILLKGDPPSPGNAPPGCRFHTRCAYATELCRSAVPAAEETAPGHIVACHHHEIAQ